MRRFDLVLKGGHVVDPSQDVDEVVDLALAHGRVAELGRDIPASLSERVVDVSGKIVTPGLIDLHAHLYWGATQVGIDADRFCLPAGVTTVVDAGTSGAFTVEGFRQFIAERTRTRILAFLNIAATGILDFTIRWESFPMFTNVQQAVEALEEDCGFLVGVKVRASMGIEAVRCARQAADQAGLPVMIHIGGSPPLCDIFAEMRPGDVLTHAFTALTGISWEGDELTVKYEPQGTGKTLLGADGHVLPEVWAARERGVLLDVGHGLNSLDFAVCRGAMQEGLLPDTISTDLHGLNVGSGCDLPAVMSKFLALGMPFFEIVRRTTLNPARIIGRTDELGTVRVGAVADVAVFELQEGEFEFEDCRSETLRGPSKLIATHTIRDGELVWSRELQKHSELHPKP